MAAPATSGAAAADDADPVIASYNVFLKPALPAHQRLLVLQYPNRVDKAAASALSASAAASMSGQTPSELRIKSSSGMVELDIPLDYTSAYDKAKGVTWGTSLANSTKAKAGGSHGLAGGFGVGGVQPGGRGARAGAASSGAAGGSGAGPGASTAAVLSAAVAGHVTSQEWSEAVRQDRVLRQQTLGGMCPPSQSTEARWMIGVFDGGNLHLTPVNSMVHLRPQLHHIDAMADLDRQKHSGSTGAGAGGMGARGPGGGPGAAAARAIHMTIKSAGADGDEVVTETMADRLRAVQTENWARLSYVGDDDEKSWDVYDQTFFLRPSAAAAAAAAADAAEGGKGKETAVAAAVDGEDNNQHLAEKVPSLRTPWTEDDMLEAISGIPKPAADGPRSTAAAAATTAATVGTIKDEPTGSAAMPPPARSASQRRTASSSATAATRGVRAGRASAGRSTAMDLD